MDKMDEGLFYDLKEYSKLGVQILLEDSVSTPQEIYQTCMLCENMPYMCDFIFREDEKLSELHFRKIKTGKEKSCNVKQKYAGIT